MFDLIISNNHHHLDPPIVAKRLRFYPVSKQNRTICMRVEVYVINQFLSISSIHLYDLVTDVYFPMVLSLIPCRTVVQTSIP